MVKALRRTYFSPLSPLEDSAHWLAVDSYGNLFYTDSKAGCKLRRTGVESFRAEKS